jgi:predicted MFS family arabinose efflux permease
VSRLARYRLLAVLYASQFFPLGFFYYALTAVLRKRGVPLEQIGALQLLALFWVVKFAWAPLLDRYGSRRLGHYRGWLLLLQGLMVVAVLLLLPLDVGDDLPLVFVLVGTIAFLSATQDVATDATAVRVLLPSERGLANGIQLACGYFGFIVGGGGILVIYDHLGWAAAVGVLALATAVPVPFVLQYRESPRDIAVTAGSEPRHNVSFRALADFFHQPGIARWLLIVLPLNYMGIATAYKLITPMLVDIGWPLDWIGAVVAFGGGTVAMASALSAGALLSAVGRRTALLVFGVIAVAAIAMLAALLVERPTVAVVLGVVTLVNVAYASIGTTIFTLSMDWSRRETAGTDYTIQTSVAVMCSDVAGAAGLSFAGIVGYPTVIAMALALALAGMAAAARLPSEPPAIRRTDTPDPVPLA